MQQNRFLQGDNHKFSTFGRKVRVPITHYLKKKSLLLSSSPFSNTVITKQILLSITEVYLEEDF